MKQQIVDDLYRMTIMNMSNQDDPAGNASDYELIESVPDVYKLASRIQKIAVPIIVTFGLFGNLISITVFLSKIQRKASSSLYIAARSLFDTGFLLSLFIVWLDDVGIKAFRTQGICQVVIFFTYICGCLSAWMVVVVTFENYIRICHPFSVNIYCTTNKAIILITVFTVGAFIFYNFPLWTTSISINEVTGESACSPIPQHSTINQFVTYSDTVLTLLLPLVLIVFIMAAIIYKLLQSFHRRARLRGKRSERNERRRSPQSQVTKLLFAISVIFITLSLPSHVLRIKMTIVAFANGGYIQSYKEAAVHLFFQTLYYCSFSVNIIVYMFFGKTFRKVYVDIYFLWILKRIHKTDHLALTQKTDKRSSCSVFENESVSNRNHCNLLIKDNEAQCLTTDL